MNTHVGSTTHSPVNRLFTIPSVRSDSNAVSPPYLDVMVGGGIGGCAADFVMHSVDTVKTRLQGQPYHRLFKYHNMVQAYGLILKEEGVLRGLYAGVTPAMLGSLPGTSLYFGVYELTKRVLTGNNVPDVVAHLAAGSLGDLAASVVYVPSEVLKTRMQLQGRYNNPHFISGYNYRSTWHAARVIVKYDGIGALFHGFNATILRDVPYSALQFACYERFKKIAQQHYVEPGQQLPVFVDMLTGSMAGGIAGAITTPLDVMKTLLQTQQASKGTKTAVPTELLPAVPIQKSSLPQPKHYSGILEGLLWNYRNQGMAGLFRGIGPRVFWTSSQSALMFVIYEQVLHLEQSLREKGEWPPNTAVTNLLGSSL
ncbi:mitochondrial carrier protein [Spinellus fusiger]|nr:mitochondrial carrier protein [Spinellus fusiger]